MAWAFVQCAQGLVLCVSIFAGVTSITAKYHLKLEDTRSISRDTDFNDVHLATTPFLSGPRAMLRVR
ncbi:hypothetical protein L208DRAFT_1405439 [Tricholoma matsutake]|nr:hypothetical protein L208DRAFT_1405439 [Tricholoma matsutake 945]